MQLHDNMLEIVKNLGTRVGSIGFVNLFRDTKLFPITFLSNKIGVKKKNTTIFSFLSLNL